MSCDIIFINEEKVLQLINWELTYEAIKEALIKVYKKEVVQNPRTFTKSNNGGALLLTMPGYLKSSTYGALACKLVTQSLENVKLQPPLPSIAANIVLFDENTGFMKAIVGGTEITKWRTAAASVVATKYLLISNGRKCQVLGILGAGNQGRIHAIAFQHFFQLKEVRIWNHNVSKAQILVNELNNLYEKQPLLFKPVDTNEECVRGADVIITATSATKPIVELEWLNSNVHINAIGAGETHHSELSESIYRASDIYIDHIQGADIELSGLKRMGLKFKGEIGEVICNNLLNTPSKSKVKRTKMSDNTITIFQSLGMAVEDCAMARLIYDLHCNTKN